MNKNDHKVCGELARSLDCWLVEQGATLINPDDPACIGYRLPTRIGTLKVHTQYLVLDDAQDPDPWIACRWLPEDMAEVNRALGQIGGGRLNQFSGKWNWHTYEQTPPGTQGRPVHVNRMIEAFRATLLDIGLKEPVDQPADHPPGHPVATKDE